MSRVAINTGSVANDGTGDSLRIAGGIINDNFSEIYSQFGDGTSLTPTWDKSSAGINTTASVGIGTTNPRFTLEVGAVGTSGTSLWVNGNARVTGILTVGSSSIVLDGNANKILVGSGISFDGNTGIISATAFYAGGSIISGGGGGGLNYWGSSASGISTTANVAIGTVTPSSKLTVVGNSLFSGIATFRSNITLANLTSSSNTLRFGSNSYIDQSNSDVLTFQINSGTDASGTDSSFVFRSTEPGTPDQQYDALRVYSGGNYWNRLVRVYTNFHADNNAFVGGDLQVGAASTLIGAGSTLGSFKVGAGGTVITTTSSGLVGIGTTNPRFTLEVGAVGASGTSLYVNGDARITGILTVGSGITINGDTGRIDASDFYAAGLQVGVITATTIVYEGGVTLTQDWIKTDVGIHTLGKVGIGTTNPTSTLTVKGTSALENLTVSGVSTFRNTIKIGAATTSLTTIDSLGNIGIGTNSTFNEYANGNSILSIHGRTWPGNPTVAGSGHLRIYSNKTLLGSIYGQDLTGIGFGSSFIIDSAVPMYIGSASTVFINVNGTSPTQIGSASSTTNEFIITNGGDVGIGTATPDHYDGFGSLTLDGKAYQNGPLTQYGGGIISLKSKGNNAFSIYSYSSANGISTATNIDLYHDLYFLGSTGTNLLIVTESGKVGIGTTNPTSTLTVRGGDISVGVSTSHGVILTSPNGTQYRLIVANDGTLSTTAV